MRRTTALEAGFALGASEESVGRGSYEWSPLCVLQCGENKIEADLFRWEWYVALREKVGARPLRMAGGNRRGKEDRVECDGVGGSGRWTGVDANAGQAVVAQKDGRIKVLKSS